MFCPRCGLKIDDDSVTCPYCGEKIPPVVKAETSESEGVKVDSHYNNLNNAYVPSSNASASGWWVVLGIFFPILGLIFYFTMKRYHPSVSKKAGLGAIIGASIEVLSMVIYFIIIITASLTGIFY